MFSPKKKKKNLEGERGTCFPGPVSLKKVLKASSPPSTIFHSTSGHQVEKKKKKKKKFLSVELEAKCENIRLK